MIFQSKQNSLTPFKKLLKTLPLEVQLQIQQEYLKSSFTFQELLALLRRDYYWIDQIATLFQTTPIVIVSKQKAFLKLVGVEGLILIPSFECSQFIEFIIHNRLRLTIVGADHGNSSKVYPLHPYYKGSSSMHSLFKLADRVLGKTKITNTMDLILDNKLQSRFSNVSLESGLSVLCKYSDNFKLAKFDRVKILSLGVDFNDLPTMTRLLSGEGGLRIPYINKLVTLRHLNLVVRSLSTYNEIMLSCFSLILSRFAAGSNVKVTVDLSVYFDTGVVLDMEPNSIPLMTSIREFVNKLTVKIDGLTDTVRYCH
ncbi:unnamed protein product [Ambrosiozyma monospora]|uniref:Unnamed protein product n=1 Tax=Ambrosiozyma monospora TaxID=43982 RepID=A0ACB5TW83_AMBMO|nr:unnamed protein product [Ambrosiozyma monospora]